MKRSRRVASIAIVFVLIVLSSMIYLYRVRIVASVWHLRNGYALPFAGYVVPVPANWYPEAAGNRNKLLVKLDFDRSSSRADRNPHASILLFSDKGLNEQQINTLFSQEKAFLKRKGSDIITSRVFDISGETVICMGGNQVEPMGIYDINPTTWHCKSTGGLDIRLIAIPADLPQTWEIVTHIQKKR